MRGVSFRRFSRFGELFTCSHKADSNPRKGDHTHYSSHLKRTDSGLTQKLSLLYACLCKVPGDAAESRRPHRPIDPKAGES